MRRKKEALGDCYEAAYKYIMKEGISRDLILVHAEVMGQGKIEGITYGHAFVVDNSSQIAIDKSNGRDIELPVSFYKMIGRIDDINNLFEYTRIQALDKSLETGTYGPWELVTKSGL